VAVMLDCLWDDELCMELSPAVWMVTSGRHHWMFREFFLFPPDEGFGVGWERDIIHLFMPPSG